MAGRLSGTVLATPRVVCVMDVSADASLQVLAVCECVLGHPFSPPRPVAMLLCSFVRSPPMPRLRASLLLPPPRWRVAAQLSFSFSSAALPLLAAAAMPRTMGTTSQLMWTRWARRTGTPPLLPLPLLLPTVVVPPALPQREVPPSTTRAPVRARRGLSRGRGVLARRRRHGRRLSRPQRTSTTSRTRLLTTRS